jgi:membrane associated rhomboid family serine protease
MLFYWFITQLFSGVGSIAVAQIGGVAFWAHVGGFATGYLIAKFSQDSRGHAEEGELLD